MHRPQKPSQCQVVIEKLQAIPGLAGGRYVDQRQQNTGYDLQAEQHHGGAAENIPPACATRRDRMLRRLHNRLCEPQPALQPTVDFYAALL